MTRGIKLTALATVLLLAAPLQAREVDHSGHSQAADDAAPPVEMSPPTSAVPTEHSGHEASPVASAPTDHSGHHPVEGPASDAAAAPPSSGDHSTTGEEDHSAHQMHDHSSHQMSAPEETPGVHDHGAMSKPLLAPVTGPGPVLPAPTAEEVRAAFPELAPHAHMQAPRLAQLLVDRLEAQDADGEVALRWDTRAMIGNDFDRLVVSSEGERLHGETEEARHELYWRRAVSRWWESRLGVRHDAGAGPGRDWLAFGVEGLAPFFVELSAVAYVGENGRSAFTLEAEYDLRLTNRLILQPRLELDVHGRGDAARGLGSGLAGSEAGLRLRYEIRREFAPYLGVEWLRLRGDTADLARTGGERTGEARAVAGFRLWY